MQIRKARINLELLRRHGRDFPTNSQLKTRFKMLGGAGITDYFGGAMDGALQGTFAGILVSDAENRIYAYQEQRTLELLQSFMHISSLGIKISELDLCSGEMRHYASDFSPRLATRHAKNELSITEFSKPGEKENTFFLACLAVAQKYSITEEIKNELEKLMPSFVDFFPALAGFLSLPFELTQEMMDNEAQRRAEHWKETLKRSKYARTTSQTSPLDLISMQIDALILDKMREITGASNEEEFRQIVTSPVRLNVDEYRHVEAVDWHGYWRFWQEVYESREIDLPVPDLPARQVVTID